jgi:hypothetical protein
LLLPKVRSRTITTAVQKAFALTPDGETMPTRRTTLFSGASLSLAVSTLVIGFGLTAFDAMTHGAAAAPPVAADVTAKAFVTKIYDAYKGKHSKGVSIANEAAIQSYFEPALAALIVKDQKAAAKRKEVPAVDFDPICGYRGPPLHPSDSLTHHSHAE